MSFFGFSREDIARQLSDLAKKDLIPNYPNASPNVDGLSEFAAGRQGARDPEVYLYYSDFQIPAAVGPIVEFSDNKKWQAGSTSVPQKLLKPRMRPNPATTPNPSFGVNGQDVDINQIFTVEDGASGNLYGTATGFVYNPWSKPIPPGEIGVAVLIGGVLFAMQRPPTRRIRFRLYTDFDDKGFALATVLDEWNTSQVDDYIQGSTNICYGSMVTVTDPRKLFAHAIGESSLASIHGQNLNNNDMLHAGGSVGYAVETYQIADCDSSNPFSCITDCPTVLDKKICYPRFEVEQCTQTVNKMKVFIDKKENQPKGSDEVETLNVKVIPNISFVSHWPYVDIPDDLDYAEEEGQTVYRIECRNPHRFTANKGWAVIEKVDSPSRVQNAANRCVPYAPMGSRDKEWHIVDVELPIARYICVTYSITGQGSQTQESWQYANTFFEGSDPTGYFQPDETIDDHIETVPCLSIDCLKDGSSGLAFWDPNAQKYYVFSTDSALYGRAKNFEVVGENGETPSGNLIEYGSDCSLQYKVAQYIKAFGDNNPGCPTNVTTRIANPNLTPVEVVSDVTRSYVCDVDGTIDPSIGDESACTAEGGIWKLSEELCFDYKQIYVCKEEEAEDECINICCDDAPDPPPEPYCFYCDECQPENAQVEFHNFGLAWTAVDDGNGNIFDGGIDSLSVVFSQSLSGDCCARLEVTLQSDNPAIADQPVSANVCIEAAGQDCPSSSKQVTFTWSQNSYAGVTLPTTMCGGMMIGCVGDYGISGGQGVVPNLPNPTSGFWDEASISVRGC